MSVEKTGIVISLLAGFYDVETVDGVYRTRARGAFRNKAQKPVVGDQVKIKVGKDSGYLIEILPRASLIGRPAVANVSNVVLVMSAVEPDFSLLLLDRFLAFFSWKKVPVTIYLSKTDLISENNFNELKKILDYYLQIGYPIFYSWQELANKFTKQISQKQIWTLAGQSGAGKSTLLNYITGRKEKTAAISRSLNRGKHTTRQVQLFTLQQGFLADTPGFSAIELSPIKITNLKNYFREFNLASQNCKFRGCQHLHEPGCEVKRQVTSGEIRKSRYDNYLLLRQEIISGRIPEYLKK